MSEKGQREKYITCTTRFVFDNDRYEAMCTRDPRFDGVFFVGVRSTGIYCRPICPARTPGRAQCVFFARAALAESEGFRACLRCRPERAPGDASVDAVSRLVRAALARIDTGELHDRSLEDFASDLGVSARHLRRAVESVLGVSLVRYAQSRRVALARELLRDTALPITEIAFASGFRSVRRFNTSFHSHMGCAPSELRRSAKVTHDTTLTLRLDYRPPIAWKPLLAFLGGRVIPGVECVDDTGYIRTVRLGESSGWIHVSRMRGYNALTLRVSRGLAPRLIEVVAKVRHLFDLDAHPQAVDAFLARDEMMKWRVERLPGLRVPGTVDGFEMLVRAVLGQQVSVRAATTLAGRLVVAMGDVADGMPSELSRWFPTPARLCRAEVSELCALGILRSRAETLISLARAVHRGRIDLRPGGDPDVVLNTLTAIPGIGPWTAQYVAMRALRWPDAFPAEDLVVRKALGNVTTSVARNRGRLWSPWRSYATMHLWQAATLETEKTP
jgi:AraC family transcriptional regulator, regulatory protein of adaptative response / DNA-3-methyladenine glycosylase II